MIRVRPILAGAIVLAAACGGDDPVAPKGDPCPRITAPAQTIPVLGMGRVCERITAEVNVRGTTAYTSTWNGGVPDVLPGNVVKIWDISGDNPTLVDSLTFTSARTTSDVQVSDDGSLLVVSTETTGGSIAIFSLADPRKPTLLTRYSTPNTSQGVHTAEIARVNGTLYAFLSVDPGATPARLVIVSLANPAQPVEVFSAVMGQPFIHDAFVRDGFLFTALWDAGLSIYDIGGGGKGGTPGNPVFISNVVTVGGNVHNVWWFHDPRTGSKRWAFVGEEQSGSGPRFSASLGDIHVVDLANIAAPVEVAVFSLANENAGTHNFSLDEASGVLYAAYYNAGVRAIDVRGDLSACTAAQKTADGRCSLNLMGRELGRALAGSGSYVWGVQHVGNRLYASDMKNGLWKLDISGLIR